MTGLGSKKRPAVVNVHSMQEAEEIMKLCNERGWQVIAGMDPCNPRDVSDIERLLNPSTVKYTEQKTSRNEPCPCGSGKKYKKCCGKN